MSRLWKSQELFGAPFGPMRAEDPVRLAVALDASAEHKLADMTCADLPAHRFPPQLSPKHTTNPILTSSPFGGSLPVLTDELLAAYQDACLKGQAPPAFSLASGSNLTSQSHSLDSSQTRRTSSAIYDEPVFSLTDITSVPMSPPPAARFSGALRASTGNLPHSTKVTHRRTRSYFYALGEAPIVASGDELQDDDESSDDDASTALLETSPASQLWTGGSLNTVLPVMAKQTPPIALPVRPAPKMRYVEEVTELPDSPPSRASAPLHGSMTNVGSASIWQPNSPKETPAAKPIFDTSDLASIAHSQPDPVVPLNTLSLLPPSPPTEYHAPNSREQEWKDLESSMALRFSMGSHEDLCRASCKNAHKNRYAQILALDATRVKLGATSEDGSDYINASFVKGAGESVYISAQAPIPATYGDFWRMIWEQHVHIIVMLTKLIESGCPKAHKYWPTSKTRVYGERFKVTLVNRFESDYEYRLKEFEVECDGERRRLFQFQFTGWPDHGAPTSPESLLRMTSSINEYMQEVKQYPFSEGPSPRVYEYHHSSSTSEGRASLSSSTSGSVKSITERPLMDLESEWNSQTLANSQGMQATIATSGGLPCISSASCNGSDGSRRTRRCSSSQLPIFGTVQSPSSGVADSTPHSASATLRSSSATGPNTPSTIITTPTMVAHLVLNEEGGAADAGSESGAGSGSMLGSSASPHLSHQRHESHGVAQGSKDSILGAEYASNTFSRSANQLTSTTRFTASLQPQQSPSRLSPSISAASLPSDSGPSLPSSTAGYPTTSSSSTSLVSSYSSASTAVSAKSLSAALPNTPVYMSGLQQAMTTPKETTGMSASSQHSNSSIPAPTNFTPLSGIPGVTYTKPVPCPAYTRPGYTVGPMLIHCSAGIGRSGAFIMIHSVLDKLNHDGKLENDIDLRALLEDMRHDRLGLVPHQHQYNFCYEAIDYALRSKSLQQEFLLSTPSQAQAQAQAQHTLPSQYLEIRPRTRLPAQRSHLNRSSHCIPNSSASAIF